MAVVGADWKCKLATLTRGLEWASGVPGVWKFQNDAFQAPSSNDPWFELRMRRLFEVAPAEVVACDNIDPATGQIDLANPRIDLTVLTLEFICELRTFGRDQEHDVVAWVIANTARSRMRMPYFRTEFLNKTPNVADPNPVPSANLAIVELFDVVAMPGPEVVSDRWQSEAVLEIRLATTEAHTDPAGVGTWIEKVEISSNIKQPDGATPIDSTLQLSDKLIDASTP